MWVCCLVLFILFTVSVKPRKMRFLVTFVMNGSTAVGPGCSGKWERVR